MKKRTLIGLLVLLVAVFSFACSGGSGSGSSGAGGAVSLYLTDGPGDYDHVWITVQEAWIHRSGGSEPKDAGWHKYPLATPVTIDLLQLSNGAISDAIWNKVTLPAGHYQQIRIILADTDDPLVSSAALKGLQFNNEVVIGAEQYPLVVPDAKNGLKISGSFQVSEGGHLRLAIDFNAHEDIVKTNRHGSTTYIFKPRLECFDLDDTGAIMTSLTPTGAIPAAKFVVKAEQPGANGKYYAVRRFTMPNPATGNVALYPLWPGTYDLVIRGLGYKTVIIRDVVVPEGTKGQAGVVTLPTITMVPAGTADHLVDGSIVAPTGAWVNFYQGIGGSGALHQVRFSHFNPLTGRFEGFELPADEVLIGSFSGGILSALTATTPAGGNGAFTAVAGAAMYLPSDPVAVTSSTATVTFGTLSVMPPAVPRSITGTIRQQGPAATLNKGVVFAVHGGMLMHAISIDSLLAGGLPASYTLDGLPGGTAAQPLTDAMYTVEAIAWSTVTPSAPAISVAMPRAADLSKGDATSVNLDLWTFAP
jgi:hypothetical protein